MHKLDLYRSTGAVIAQLNLGDVLAYNEETIPYGLYFTASEAEALIEARQCSIRNHGRVELGTDVVNTIITVFCRSPYINRDDYAETINELLDMFYELKNETEDRIGDDELIAMMFTFYNGSCKGSLDLLRNREMAVFARYYRRLIQEQEIAVLLRSKKG